MKEMETMLDAYYETMFWAEQDTLTELGLWELELSEAAKDKSKTDCEKFLALLDDELINSLDLAQVGHDFWLTRNGHGAGFWDGDYSEEQESALMLAVSHFQTVDFYSEHGFLQID